MSQGRWFESSTAHDKSPANRPFHDGVSCCADGWATSCGTNRCSSVQHASGRCSSFSAYARDSPSQGCEFARPGTSSLRALATTSTAHVLGRPRRPDLGPVTGRRTMRPAFSKARGLPGGACLASRRSERVSGDKAGEGSGSIPFDLVIEIKNEPGALARVAAAISDAGTRHPVERAESPACSSCPPCPIRSIRLQRDVPLAAGGSAVTQVGFAAPIRAGSAQQLVQLDIGGCNLGVGTRATRRGPRREEPTGRRAGVRASLASRGPFSNLCRREKEA